MQVANGKYLPKVFESVKYDGRNLKDIFSTLKDTKIFVTTEDNSESGLLDSLTTKYYTMENEDGTGLISMPIICEETDTVAGVVMEKEEPESTFLGKYKNAYGYPNLEKAKKEAKKIILEDRCKVGVAFYRLHSSRQKNKDKKGDLIHAHVPICKK